MEIAFENRNLRRICENDNRAIREYGEVIAKRLRARIADISVAAHIQEVLIGEPETVSQEENAQAIIKLSESLFIFLLPNHNANPTKGTGEIDWLRVTRVKIVRIGAK